MDRRDPMTTDRRFSRFSKSPDTAAFSTTEIPEGGVCLSAFLIVAQAGQPSRILMGHMNPEAPWDHIGALDPKRVEVHSRGWMLPSSHLIFLESPEDAARRLAREQLDLPDLVPRQGRSWRSSTWAARRKRRSRGPTRTCSSRRASASAGSERPVLARSHGENHSVRTMRAGGNA